jgi:hypothetical protein
MSAFCVYGRVECGAVRGLIGMLGWIVFVGKRFFGRNDSDGDALGYHSMLGRRNLAMPRYACMYAH